MMRVIVPALLASMALTTTGCTSSKEKERLAVEEFNTNERRRLMDVGLVTSVRDASVKNAILSQHTLFPYHFVANSAELNELGERDLDVIIEHYRTYPGPLSIRRGGTTDALYDARVKAVSGALARGGVAPSKVAINSDLPAGTGMTNERIDVVMQRDMQPTAYSDDSAATTAIPAAPAQMPKGGSR